MQFQIYLPSGFASNSSLTAIISIKAKQIRRFQSNSTLEHQTFRAASLSGNLELQLAWPLAGVKMSIENGEIDSVRKRSYLGR